ncbi:precorrin-3B C17-methyltransferase [Enterococcus sp. PF1-24]|uniref:precorrin-3B C(17)-methyltransferase n=1 Tax=unclassified Enterococcus TaxID=2608891 RepID=UPI0024766D68|nr:MULTISPECIES: precorrin-3B C(17)-methyltransferase [unclassified Enterococcus]MDH6363381.1 precorrin-3B C17-methyltransferase [Enterococcus sp. PFB1-1]MDH6400318.1 precorrin-3B C17-methyltransferase [Enterococcus sp. PF1-24]
MLYVIGLGPGGRSEMTYEAVEALQKAEVIVGYTTYIRLIKEFITDKEVVTTGMKQEIDRCQKAIDIALTGKEVAVVSSGDAGVYGMAGLILELVSKMAEPIEVKVIPGITASIGGAALLGAPLMNDFCHISLSDLMTPWEMIEKRLQAAAAGDFVICLYNPRSKGRPKHLAKALAIIKEYKGGATIVGLAKDVGRKDEATIITTIDELDENDVDMTTVVLIGNKETFVSNGLMVTPRGYQL